MLFFDDLSVHHDLKHKSGNSFLSYAARIIRQATNSRSFRLSSLISAQTGQQEYYCEEQKTCILTLPLHTITHKKSFLFVSETPLVLSAKNPVEVDCLFVLIYPPKDKLSMLADLAWLTRMVKTTPVVEKIRGSETKDAIIALFHEYLEQRKAA